MAESTSAMHSPRGGGRRSVQRLAWLLVGLSLLAMLPGCGGCSCLGRTKTQAELDQELEDRLRREELEKERLKPPLDVGVLTSEPYDPRQKNFDFYYKPGHWTAAMLPAKANHEDLYGDLELTVVDAQNQPLGLTGTPYTLSTERAIALGGKKPHKRLETQAYLPNTWEKSRVVPRITAKRGGRLYEGPAQASRMPAYQYFFVVLASWPERYAYLDKIDSCRLPKNFMMDVGSHELYRVVRQQAQKQTALPTHSLFWTSTAVVLWDEAAPEALTPDQQVAMLDWLHWGGLLIISGPDSLGTLKDSFLGDYLPATAGVARPLQADDLKELDAHWPVQDARDPAIKPLKPARPWSGVELQLQPEARFLPNTGQLVAERRVGRGRVVVSAFPLNGSDVVGWRGFDSFFNACLLGHPGRIFSEREGVALVSWNRAENGASTSLMDPRHLSQVRYFTRDTERSYVAPSTADIDTPITEEPTTGTPPSDVASWCDSNAVANAARDALKDAARIEIPSSMFVVWIVAIYLVVLVPLNWLVFRGLDRVEWAWVAAPLIAVACTGLVIHLAQLDIGFARSATEIAVVELQGNYPRAHVTRYTALYTSLSTEYRFLADDAGSQMLPFPNRLDDLGIRFGRTNLLYRYGQSAELAGVRVLSNSTGLVHSEQMLDLKGRCELLTTKDGQYTLLNDTDLPLHGVGVMRIDEQNRLYVAWLDEVAPHDSRTVAFEYRLEKQEDAASPWNVFRDGRPETAAKSEGASEEVNRSRTSGTLNIRPLIDLAERGFLRNPQRRPGDARLVAWTDAAVPGLTVEPVAPQVRKAALVVADLRHGHGADPASDSNTHKVLEVPARVLNPE